MLMKKPKYKHFDYQPRYYNPLKDLEKRKKDKLSLSGYRKTQKKKSNIIILLLLIVLIIYLMILLK